jgi:hypothetical protein
MISAADFDGVFGWNHTAAWWTAAGDHQLDPNARTDRRAVPATAANPGACAQALPREARDLSEVPQTALETHAADFADTTA